MATEKGYGNSCGGYALLIVLFILFVIVIGSCWGGYGGA
ncbi:MULTISPECIES: sporulation protein YjcZ [Bacillus]|nr:sporulation protein YjcZ [Bacillus mycoides]OOR00353.1 sporulation protein YjcZ [Bacillus mycoides]HDR7590429.1 sporulation protein YjcZ [Bacillus mycoides]